MIATQQWVREYFPAHTCTTAHRELGDQIVSLRNRIGELEREIKSSLGDVKQANCDHCPCQKIPWLVESFGDKMFTMTYCCKCQKQKLVMDPWVNK